MLKWGAIVFGIGMLLILFEWSMARKKKGGVSFTDRQRMIQIFWISIALALLTMGLIWMS